jgi:hypothetical protein
MTGILNIKQMKPLKKLVVWTLCWLFAGLSANLYSQTTVNLNTPGDLHNQGIANVTHITLTGSVDVRDVKYMRDNMPNLAKLDLSRMTIVAYGGMDGTVSETVSYLDNEMLQYLFCEYNTKIAKTSLTSVVLPNGITSIGNDVFRN